MSNTRQALHILLKDIRLLRLEIVFALIVLAAFTTIISIPAGSISVTPTVGQVASELLTYLLPLTWWLLITRAIYNEPLIGDRQFWITRPYVLNSLLLSKGLFLFLFILLPKFLSDAVITSRYGFSISTELTGLLWNQALLFGLYVLPVTAIAVMTAGLVQFILVAFIGVLTFAIWTLVLPNVTADATWHGMEWIRYYLSGSIVAITSLIVIFYQYSQKDVKFTCRIAGIGLVLVFLPLAVLPWRSAYSIQTLLSNVDVNTDEIGVEVDQERKWSMQVVSRDSTEVDFRIPIRLNKLPRDTRPQIDGAALAVQGPGMNVLRSQQHPTGQVLTDEMLTSLRIRVDKSFYTNVRSYPLRVTGSLYVTLYGNTRRVFIPLEDHAPFHQVPSVGLCSLNKTGRGASLNCRSAFKARLDLVTVEVVGGGSQIRSFQMLSTSRPTFDAYTPFPASFSLVPVTLTTRHTEAQGEFTGVMVTVVEPVAHIVKHFELDNLRFGGGAPPLAPPLIRSIELIPNRIQ